MHPVVDVGYRDLRASTAVRVLNIFSYFKFLFLTWLYSAEPADTVRDVIVT